MRYKVYYDRSKKKWIAFWTDGKGNKVGNFVSAPKKDACLILLGMEWENASNEQD